MDALSQILAALSVKSYTATGVRGGGFSIAYPAYPGMKLLVPRKGKMYFLKKASSVPDSALSDAGHASAGSSALSEAQSTSDWIELLPGSFLLMVEPTGFILPMIPSLSLILQRKPPMSSGAVSQITALSPVTKKIFCSLGK